VPPFAVEDGLDVREQSGVADRERLAVLSLPLVNVCVDGDGKPVLLAWYLLRQCSSLSFSSSMPCPRTGRITVMFVPPAQDRRGTNPVPPPVLADF
jgi:hypothetical protein